VAGSFSCVCEFCLSACVRAPTGKWRELSTPKSGMAFNVAEIKRSKDGLSL